MVAEMKMVDMVPGEHWPLFVDGERVGEIYNWEKGKQICKAINAARELYATFVEIEYADNGCCFCCGNGPEMGHMPKCPVGNVLYEEDA